MRLQNLLEKLEKTTRVIIYGEDGNEIADTKVNPLDMIPLLNYYVEKIQMCSDLGLYVTVRRARR